MECKDDDLSILDGSSQKTRRSFQEVVETVLVVVVVQGCVSFFSYSIMSLNSRLLLLLHLPVAKFLSALSGLASERRYLRRDLSVGLPLKGKHN